MRGRMVRRSRRSRPSAYRLIYGIVRKGHCIRAIQINQAWRIHTAVLAATLRVCDKMPPTAVGRQKGEAIHQDIAKHTITGKKKWCTAGGIRLCGCSRRLSPYLAGSQMSTIPHGWSGGQLTEFTSRNNSYMPRDQPRMSSSGRMWIIASPRLQTFIIATLPRGSMVVECRRSG